MHVLAETFPTGWEQLIIGPTAAVFVLAIMLYLVWKMMCKTITDNAVLVAKKDETIQKITTESVACITNISAITAANSIALKDIASGIAQVVENTKQPKRQ